VSLANETGSESVRFGLATNLGHLLLLRGRYEEAHEWLVSGLEGRRLGGGSEIAIRDTLMSLYLAQDSFDRISAEAETIQDLIKHTAGHDAYFGLWHLLTRVKWLYRTGEASAGLTLALDAIPRIERMADRNLLERMQLLAAEGLGRTGRHVEGAALMAQAIGANPDPPLELIAEAARVAGRLAAADNPGAALGHFARAARILQGVGNLTAQADIQRDLSDTLSPSAPAAWLATSATSAPGAVENTPMPGHPSDQRPPVAPLTERLAALVELAAHPPLLAAETLTLIADTDAVFHATIIETFPDGRRELTTAYSAPGSPAPVDNHPDVVRIAFGTHRDRQYSIAVLPQPSASARATLLAVERLVHTAMTLAQARQEEREQAALWPDHTTEQQLGLVCASAHMLDLIKTIRRVAASNVTVMLSGETGVGKELFARALHLASPRSERPFTPFNCTTVSRELLDSQLFGHRRGAFTGALEDSPGLIRGAAGGTLFLDEIGEMSTDLQPKLLRFLESGEILPLGETRPQLVDVRIVAASNAHLEELVACGRFREDLFYRLNVIPILIPPLRERREEIPALVEHFLDRYGRELQKPRLRVADEAIEYLLLYNWPGNVRQLANEIRRLVVLAEPDSTIQPAQLAPNIVASRRSVAMQPTEIVMRIDQPLTAATEALERAAIERAMQICEGRVEDAAKMLGLSRKGLYLKRQRLGLE
jgi:DNA-binding NtrC family response regulator